MIDPITTLTAAKITEIAFGEFIKSGAGEVAKKLTGNALTKADELRQKIVTWFRKKQDVKAEKAITAIEKQGSLDAVRKLTTYLDDEMDIEPAFSQDLQRTAIQIINIQNANDESRGDRNYFSVGNIDGGENVLLQGTNTVHHIGDVVHQSVSPSGEELLSRGVQLLNQRAYSEAESVLKDAIKADPSILDAYYYLAIALLSGEKPRKIDGLKIKEIEEKLNSATLKNPNSSECYTLWAIIKHGYYVMNGLIEKPPTSAQLFNQSESIQAKHAWEILNHLNDPENIYWKSLRNKFGRPN